MYSSLASAVIRCLLEMVSTAEQVNWKLRDSARTDSSPARLENQYALLHVWLLFPLRLPCLLLEKMQPIRSGKEVLLTSSGGWEGEEGRGVESHSTPVGAGTSIRGERLALGLKTGHQPESSSLQPPALTTKRLKASARPAIHSCASRYIYSLNIRYKRESVFTAWSDSFLSREDFYPSRRTIQRINRETSPGNSIVQLQHSDSYLPTKERKDGGCRERISSCLR